MPSALTDSLAERMVYDFSAMHDGLRGYVWLFPAPGGRLNVGAMHYPSRKLSGAAIEQRLRAALVRYGVTLPAGARGWPAWRYRPAAAVAAPHVLCVGDAAGIDALTGEGIAVGLEHGPIAAAAIAAALAPATSASRVTAPRVARAVVGRELALDGRLAAMLYAPRAFPIWLSLILFDRRDAGALRRAGVRLRGAGRPQAELVAALGRHALRAPARLLALRRSPG